MKVNIFKKLIRDIIREELDYKFSRLEKKLDEALVNNKDVKLVEDIDRQLTATGMTNFNISGKRVKPKQPVRRMSSNNVLNDILNETLQDGKWRNIEKEAQTQSVMDNTEALPDHLANALNKDYSDVMKAVDEKAKFKNGS
jgi:hypothetical protein